MKFSKKNRLLVKQDFQPVFDRPEKVTSSFLLALYRPNQQQTPRLGIILSKQRVKLAVTRNLIRRIIRESFRHLADELQAVDMIVMIRGNPKEWDRAEIRERADALFKKIKQVGND